VPQELDVEAGVEELGDVSSMGEAIAVVALTVLMSVVLHGVSAGLFGSRYVRAEATEPEPAGPDVARARRVGHRHHAHQAGTATPQG